MKKLILGIGLLVLSMITVASISGGRSLKASDELVENTDSQTSIETTVPSQPINDLPPEVIEAVPAEPVQEVAETVPETETISSETQVTEETSVLEESGTSESLVEESTTETSTTSSSESTTETTTETSTTSTTETSTSQSQTEESSTTTEASSSSSQDSLTSTESTTEVSSEPPVTEPTSEPEEPAIAPPSAASEPVIASFPAQPSVVVPTAPLPTVGSSNPLGNREVELDESLRVSQVAESDFNGYELPLLSSFNDSKPGVLIYEGLKQLGEKEKDYTVQELVEGLFNQLFNEGLADKNLLAIEEKDLQSGDLLIVENRIIGLYLGEDHYLTVQEKEAEDLEEESKQEVVISRLSEREEEKRSGKRPANLTKTAYAEEVEKDYPASFAIDANDQTQQFIDQLAVDAQKLGLKYDVFASVMIAQAILESGSGTSGLAVAPNYNLFGVKGSYSGQSVSLPTQEDRGNGELYTISAAFRRYPSYAESLGDYVSLIREGISGNGNYYQEVWRSESKNYLRAAQALTGKYATDTSYHKKISSIIAAYHLTLYDEPLPESGSTSAILQGKESIPAEYRKKMKLPDYDGKNYNTSGSYPVGQCTWYAFNRVAQLGGRVDDFMGNGGEWGAKGRALGYEVTQTPKAGYLVSFTPGTAGSDPRYGHVAFVEAVTDEGILISEGNVVGGTTISYRVISNDLAKSNLVSYIKPK